MLKKQIVDRHQTPKMKYKRCQPSINVHVGLKSMVRLNMFIFHQFVKWGAVQRPIPCLPIYETLIKPQPDYRQDR